jgi:hypothetical protein
LHREPIPAADPSDQVLVRSRLHWRQSALTLVAGAGAQVQTLLRKIARCFLAARRRPSFTVKAAPGKSAPARP